MKILTVVAASVGAVGLAAAGCGGTTDPTRGHIAFVRGGTLIVAAADGTHPRAIARSHHAVDRIDGPVSWTADGRILFLRSVRDVAGGSTRSIEPDGTGERAVSGAFDTGVSPDGAHVAYVKLAGVSAG